MVVKRSAKSNEKKHRLRCYGNNEWERLLVKLIGPYSQRLRMGYVDKQRYNRDLLFALLCDFLTQMMEMDRKLKKFKRPSKREDIVQKMVLRYGEDQVKRWKELKISPELNEIAL